MKREIITLTMILMLGFLTLSICVAAAITTNQTQQKECTEYPLEINSIKEVEEFIKEIPLETTTSTTTTSTSSTTSTTPHTTTTLCGGLYQNPCGEQCNHPYRIGSTGKCHPTEKGKNAKSGLGGCGAWALN